jgi:phosphoglucomutase
MGIKCYETPTGWKFFSNLLDAGLCTLCGEESFGTGSNHLREKDGVWAVLCWLSLLAATKKSVADVVEAHWLRFGRSYFQRHDYEGLPAVAAGQMIEELYARLPSLPGTQLAGLQVALADDFCYTDPVDHTQTPHAGIRILFSEGSRIVCRLSGTGTEGATLRLYLERYCKDEITADVDAMLNPLAQAARNLLALQRRFGREQPTVIT